MPKKLLAISLSYNSTGYKCFYAFSFVFNTYSVNHKIVLRLLTEEKKKKYKTVLDL